MEKKNYESEETLELHERTIPASQAKEYLELLQIKLNQCSSKTKKKYLEGIIHGLEASFKIREEKKDEGFLYLVVDTAEIGATFDFFESVEEAKAHVHKLIIEEFRSAETIMVIKGHELPLMAGFVND